MAERFLSSSRRPFRVRETLCELISSNGHVLFPALIGIQGWQPVWLAFTSFGVALIVARLLFGHLPDKFGGTKIAMVFVIVQASGLALMWIVQTALIASTGAALAGLGYSLVYPGLGVEAVRGTASNSRGLAMGIYTAFLDVALALGSPVLGWVAEGMSAVFVVSVVIALGTAIIALRLLLARRPSGKDRQAAAPRQEHGN